MTNTSKTVIQHTQPHSFSRVPVRLVMSIAFSSSVQPGDPSLPEQIPDKSTRDKIYQALVSFENRFSPYHPFGSSPDLPPKPNYLIESLLITQESSVERVHVARFLIFCHLLGGAGPKKALEYVELFDRQRLKTMAQSMYDPRGYDCDKYNLSTIHRSTVNTLRRMSPSEIRSIIDAMYNKRGVEDYILQVANSLEALQKDLSIAFDHNLLPAKVVIALATHLY